MHFTPHRFSLRTNRSASSSGFPDHQIIHRRDRSRPVPTKPSRPPALSRFSSPSCEPARTPYSPTQKLKNASNSAPASCGPGQASGWYCTLNTLGDSDLSPSQVWSLREECVTATPAGRLSGSTANEWVLRGDVHLFRAQILYGVVRPVVAELELVRPARPGPAREIWCPRQIPTTGTRPMMLLTFSTT